MTAIPTFTCSSCDALKPLAGARSVDGALWCEDCAAVADRIDEWVAATEPTRVVRPKLLAALVEATVEDDEPTLTDALPLDFDDEPTRVVAMGGW